MGAHPDRRPTPLTTSPPTGLAPEHVAAAAWLHDIGYSPTLAVTGFHPLDGATWLLNHGAPERVAGLVAFHTGAPFEAEQRGLSDELAAIPAPDPDELDIMTLCDLTSTPAGEVTTPEARITEILTRYGRAHAVHLAVTRSRPHLLAAAHRARESLDLPDDWANDALAPNTRSTDP